MLKLGLIINPIAGMGGRVALKGTDGAAVLAEARRRGALPQAGEKAEKALQMLLPYRDKIRIFTAAGPMGEDTCRKLCLPYETVHRLTQAESSPADTMAAARALKEIPVDLLLFAGGDGTARDICGVIGESLPALGIPAGVKIQSAVFALTPEDGGAVAASLAAGEALETGLREVVDLDEDLYRRGQMGAKLYGNMRIPGASRRLQSMKQGGFSGEAEEMEAIASYLEEHLEEDCIYAIGSGSAAKCLSRRLGLPYELLGVDVMKNRRLLARDAGEEELWHFARQGPFRIIVSPIGGQGFLFGRGNHQFSPRVLRAAGKEGITVISPQAKLLSIPDHSLKIDCGDKEIHELLKGYYKVLCGYGYFLTLPCR